MSVRVTVEGGGSFELTEEDVERLRDRFVVEGLHGRLAAALPPEPYQPKEGDRVEYRFPHWERDWDGEFVYLGAWRDWHIVSHADRGDEIVPRFLAGGAVFRKVKR